MVFISKLKAVFARGYTASSATSGIWLFDLEQGFIRHNDIHGNNGGSEFLSSNDLQAGAVVPSGYFDCFFESI